MTMLVVFLGFIIKLGFKYGSMPSKMHYIKVEMKNDATFIINKDTTNYDFFASTLKKEVIDYRKKYAYNSIEIALKLPKLKTAGEIAEIIQIIDAMDVQYAFISNH